MLVEYEAAICPVCVSDQPTKLLPSAKRISDIGELKVSDTVFLACCDNCGTVFESPRIKAETHADYSTKAYYNELNNAWQHDDLQHVWARYNWTAVQNALPWETVSRVVDVGAAGAWAHSLLENVPSITESTLVEPSREAIFNAEMRYPSLITACNIFENWDTDAGSVDLVSFLNSFYSISDPRNALAKVNRVLRPEGWLIVSFSYAAAELAHWQDDTPWNTLSHLIRGVPQVYYSHRTFEKLLVSTGFTLHKNIVVTIPDNDPLGMAGRQLMFIVAQKSTAQTITDDPESFADSSEVTWAHDYFLNFCRKASQKSVDLFLTRKKPQTITVICGTDADYNAFLETGINWHDQVPRFLQEFAAADSHKLEDAKDHWVLVADDRRDLHDLQQSFSHAQIVHACPVPGYDGFGFSFTGPTGATIIARSFCPEGEVGDDVFAADIRPPDVSIDLDENLRREPLPAPRSLSTIPWLALRISNCMQSEDHALKSKLAALIIPILQRGPIENSLATEALGKPLAERLPVLSCDADLSEGTERLKDYRVIQQALAFCTSTEMQSVDQLMGN